MTIKNFWEWTFKKWYFWLIVITNSFLDIMTSDPSYRFEFTNILYSSLTIIFTWSIIFFILYMFYKNGYDSSLVDMKQDKIKLSQVFNPFTKS